jgi:hypothetical protein
LISKISYSHLFYFLQVKNQVSGTSLVVYSKTPQQIFLKWYPFFQSFQSKSLGYYSIFSACLESRAEFFSFWSTNEVRNLLLSQDSNERVSLLKFQKQKARSIFLISQNLFTKKGFFQILSKKGNYKKQNHRFDSTIIRNPLQKQTSQISEFSFLKTGLANVREKFYQKLQYKSIYKPKVWFYYPTSSLPAFCPTFLSGVILGPGKEFDGTSFENFSVSTNLLSTKTLKWSKKKIRLTELNFSVWFSVRDLTDKKPFSHSTHYFLSKKRIKILSVCDLFQKRTSYKFSFYKLAEKIIEKPEFCLQRKRRIFSLLCFQKSSYQGLPDPRTIKQKWLETQTRTLKESIHSPLFTKQRKTSFTTSTIKSLSKTIELPTHSGWFFASQVVKLALSSHSPRTYKIDSTAQKIKSSNNVKIDGIRDLNSEVDFLMPSFRLIVYRYPFLDAGETFAFQTFDNGWILPDYRITRAFRTSPVSGEFRVLRRQQCTNQVSFLTNQNVKTVNFPAENSFFSTDTPPLRHFVGSCIRWGQEIGLGFALPLSGEIVKITSTSLTIRNGIALLGSLRGLVHIKDNQFVDKNQLLLTLKSKRLETEDIVQGIPKIEQLFEARETQAGSPIRDNIHVLLENHFEALQKKLPEVLFGRAVRESVLYIQKVLVAKIVEAYSNQGVDIAEKHVEVVVRQMTNRVRITKPGCSGLLPGEFVALFFVEKLNSRRQQSKNYLPGAQYEPVILGISKSVLHSESFLHAASFQRVSQVLIQSAVARKTDFLKGLHENLLVGQLLPVGTGLFIIDRPETSEHLRLASYKSFLNKVLPCQQESFLGG